MTTLEVPHDIQSASSYINNTLISKGYIQQHEKLRFSSQQMAGDGEIDDDDEETKEPATSEFDKAVENDRRMLNLISSLLETIEADNVTRDQLTDRVHQAIKARESNEQELQRARAKCAALEAQLAAATRLNQTLEATKRGLESRNKTATEELAQLKSLHQKNRVQFGNELRKRDVAISKLKQRLQDPASRGKPLMAVSGTFSKKLNSYTSGQGVVSAGAHPNTVAMNLETLKELSRDNSMLYALCYKTKLVVENILQYGFKDAQIELSPEELDNIESLGYDVPDTDELAVFSARVIGRTTNIQQLAAETSQSLEKLSKQVNSSEMVPAKDVERKDREIQELQEQVEQVTANWKRAIKTMDEWKDFRNKK